MEQRLRDRIKNISEQKLNVGLDLTQFNEQIGKVRDELRNLGAAGSAAFDSARMDEMKAQLESSMTLLELMAQKMKELGNTGMEGLKKRAAESAENSYNKLLLKLKEVEAKYNKLDAKSAYPLTGAQGARGQKLLSQIQSLRGALREIDALKKSVNSIGDNEGMQRWRKAFAEAEFAASSTGKSIALLKAQTAATNKETVEAARVAEMARGSYDQLRAELDKTIAEYKAMSEAVRGTKKGSDTLAYIHELQSQIKAIDNAIKPVQQKLSKLQQLQNQLAELNTVGSTAQSEIEAQHAVSLAKERVKLETEYINIKDKGAASDEIYVQNLRQEVALMKQLEALQVQRRNLADPNSDERKVLALQQEIALQREQLSLENQRARLQMQLTHYSQYGYEEASLREELRLKKELAETDARLMHYYTAEAEELRKNQQKIALLQRQEQLERERVRLQERLQALQSGQDHENMALKTKVQLEEQLARLRAKRTWLGQTNGSGVTNAEEMKRLNREIRELTSNASTAETRVRDVNRAYRQGVPLLQSLVNLARNYVGVWGLWSGLRSLYRIRAEFERQEVALRALMQSASQAREVMGQLQQMALKSPFSVSDIVSFSKQLSAFSIGNNELVETTKRLADLSAGLGVDMSRLILAYGQVKAATVLRGQELRQFTEAGVPMVQALADQFTKLEGRVVTAADVFDRISKKAVSFEMVKQVLDSMTSEGGRFYDHQAKMVETLYGKMERLGDAYKVMMNQLGSSHDALLKAPIDAITKAMMDWRSTVRSIVTMLAASGVWKFVNYLKTPPQQYAGLGSIKEAALAEKRMTALNQMYGQNGLMRMNQSMAQYIALSGTMTKTDWKNAVMKHQLSKAQTMYLYTTGRLTKAHVEWIAKQRGWNLAAQQSILNMNKLQLVGMRAGIAITRVAASMRAFAAQALPVAIISLFVDMISKAIQAKQEIDDFNKQVRESAKETVDDLRSYLDSHRDAFDLIVDPKVSQDSDTLQKTWEDLKQKIATLPGQELILGVVSDGAEGDLKKLNTNAIEFLRTMERVSDEIANMNTQMEYTQDDWLYGLFSEGVKSDVKDYEDKLKEVRKEITAINDYLRHNKVNFELTIGGLDPSSINDMRDAIASAGAKEAWAGEAATRAASQLKEVYDEMSDEINASLRTSLLPVFEELRQKGITSPKEMAAAYQQIMPQIREAMGATTKEAQDTLDRLAMAMLRSNGFALDEVVLLGERAASDLRTSITREAERMGVDINDIIESNNTDTMKALLDAAIANNKDISDDTRAQFEALRNYISSHPAMFRVIMRVETQEDGEARKYLKGLSGAKNNFQLAQMYGSSTPEGGDTNEKAIKRAKDNYETALKRQQDFGRQLKNLEKQGNKNSQLYKDTKKSFDNEKTTAEQAKKAYNDLGGDPADFQPKGKKGGKTGRKTGGKGTKRDEWLDAMRNRFAEYKEARAEVEKLRKMGMSEAKAIEEVMKMPWDYDLNKDYLGRGDAKALVDYLIPLVEQHGKGLQGSFKQANNKLLMELRKAQHDDQLKQYEEEAKKIGDAIKRHIEVGVKQWKLYDALFAATGDEALSSTAAFGGKKLFRNIEEQLIALFNKNEGKVDFSAALQMDEKTLSEKLLKNADEYIDLLKRIKEMRESGWSDIMTKAAEAMEAQMTLEEKLQKQRMVNQKELSDFVARNGGMQNVLNNPELLKLYNALRNAGLRALADLEQEGVKLSAFWKGLFDKLSESTLGGLRHVVTQYGNALKDAKRNGNGTWSVPGIDQPVTEGTYREMVNRVEALKEKIRDLSLSDYLSDLFNKMWKEAENAGWKIEIVALAIDRVHDELKKATGPMKEFFSALGNDTVGDYIDLIDGVIDGIDNMAMGVGRIASGDYLGGGLQAVGGLFSTITSFFNFHDKRLEKLIEESKRTVSKLENAYSQMEKALERSLGGMYTTRSYRQQLNNLMQQRKEVQRQMDAERDKK
ncbi:MAG: tape measure protein, partial [Muribaculaceae bacterium]|nr:tape measure protein [Muribaculaceae bacterium]